MSGFLVAIVLAITALQVPGVEIIAHDNMSNVDEAGTAVASTEDGWGKLWRSVTPDKPLPKVDFARRSVVAIFLGSRPTAGYDIEIVGTKQEGPSLIVEWAEVRPQAGVMLAQVLTAPALIASIPKSAGSIGFRKVTR
jgi:hypothetical protein